MDLKNNTWENGTEVYCHKPPWFYTLGNYVNLASYVGFLPVYFVISIAGHCISLWSFFKQANHEKAYGYQIFLTAAGILDVIAFVLFLLTFQGAGVERDGFAWYQKTYILMWYSAHVAIPSSNATNSMILLLSVSMSADRVFALLNPLVYKNINFLLHQYIALSACVLIAVATTVCDGLMFSVKAKTEQEGVGYTVVPNLDFMDSTLATFFSYLSNVMRVVGLTTLISLNVVIVQQYRQRLIKISKITIQDGDAKGRKNEKSLVYLTVAQSTFTAINVLAYVIFYTAAYTIPFFNLCESLVYAPFLNCTLMCCSLLDTCAVVWLNKKTRLLLMTGIGMVMCRKADAGNSQTKTTVTGTTIGQPAILTFVGKM